MADDFLNCPNTGGITPCNPGCVLFVRNHSDLRGRRHENKCRKYGNVDKDAAIQMKKQNLEDGDEIYG